MSTEGWCADDRDGSVAGGCASEDAGAVMISVGEAVAADAATSEGGTTQFVCDVYSLMLS